MENKSNKLLRQDNRKNIMQNLPDISPNDQVDPNNCFDIRQEIEKERGIVEHFKVFIFLFYKEIDKISS